MESELLPSKKYEPIKGLANKLAEHAARIATILAVVQNSFISEVDGVNMENGIALANYYAAEAVRMCEEGSVDKQILLAERLLNWLHQNWEKDCISLPDVYQRGLNAVNSKAKALPLIALLEDHGWLVRIKAGQAVYIEQDKESYSSHDVKQKLAKDYALLPLMRYEIHLDRKLERVLSIYYKLKELGFSPNHQS